MSRLLPILAVALLVMSRPGTAAAHGMRTAYVEIVEHAPGRAVVRLQTTVAARVVPVFPEDCETTETPEPASPKTRSLVQGGSAFALHCKGPLSGRQVRVDGIGTEVSEAVLWVEQCDGTRSTHLLTAGSSTVRIPSESRAVTSFTEYFPLGVKHILEGADHLLFLLLVVLILRRPRAVLLAETAFTLSHGLSFSAAALGWIVVSKEATEACIAASLLLLALDVPKGRQAHFAPAAPTAALALVFGLVHGLGFAGGMTELGMPSQNVGWALLGFGAGVEVGQILFLAVALLGSALLSRRRFSFRPTMALTYCTGGLAAYWFLDRARSCLLVVGP
ncbi:MAG: HupE/UreJ family protein [Polyangiaceae bacterium]